VPTARLAAAQAKPLGAAGAQQSCPTRPHEPSHVRPSAPLRCPATRGLVVGVVVGIPGWHARGQGFKSPQLHQAKYLSRSPAAGRLSADCQQVTSCDGCNTLSVDRSGDFGPFSRRLPCRENFPYRSFKAGPAGGLRPPSGPQRRQGHRATGPHQIDRLSASDSVEFGRPTIHTSTLGSPSVRLLQSHGAGPRATARESSRLGWCN